MLQMYINLPTTKIGSLSLNLLVTVLRERSKYLAQPERESNVARSSPSLSLSPTRTLGVGRNLFKDFIKILPSSFSSKLDPSPNSLSTSICKSALSIVGVDLDLEDSRLLFIWLKISFITSTPFFV